VSESFEQVLKKIKQDPSLNLRQLVADIVAQQAPDAERELLSRCAVVRAFDRGVVEAVLRHIPSEISKTDMPFKRLKAAPSVEAVPRTKGVYRLSAECRDTYRNDWAQRPKDLQELTRKLVDYYRQKKKPLEELYHLAQIQPKEAQERFEKLYDKAEAAFNLTGCEELIALFSEGRALSAPLQESKRQRRARLNARLLWADDFYRTGRYLERAELREALETVLDLHDPARWALQVYAPGGAGKTMFLRWAVARVCVPRGIAVAKLDFDDAYAIPLVQEPWRLALELAKQWNLQISGEPLGEFLRQFNPQASKAPSRPMEQLARLAAALPRQQPILLILDTLEEILIPYRNTLAELLKLVHRFHAACPQLVLLLAGRYDLRPRLGEDYAIQGSALDQEVKPFRSTEARRYLTSKKYRGLRAPKDVVKAVISCAAGNPLKLALYVEILQDDPELTADTIRADSDVDVAYLIRRIILRLKDVPLRWVLRYAAIPRRLTYEFLTEVMADHLRREITDQGSTDDPNKGLSSSLIKENPFPRVAPNAAIDFRQLWEKLKLFVGDAAWVRLSHDAAKVEFLLLTPDVLEPMRSLLLAQEQNVFLPLHNDALAYYRHKAETDPAQRIDLVREIVYHDFQLRGEAAGQTWRGWIESDEFLSRPDWCKALAEEVVSRTYIEDDDPPRPRRRRDQKYMIAPDDLVLAYYHLAAANVHLARANPPDADKMWKEAAEALGRLDLARRNLSVPATLQHRIAHVSSLILANQGQFDNALTLLDEVQSHGDPAQRLQALRETANLRAKLGRRDALEAFQALLEHAIPSDQRWIDLWHYASALLAFDRIEEALRNCSAAIYAGMQLDPPREEKELHALYRQILLRSGCPKRVSEAPWLLGPGLQKDWIDPQNMEAAATALALAEAKLDQLDPHQATRELVLRSVLPVRSQRSRGRGTAKSGTAPPIAAILELSGRIASELLDVRAALDHLSQAQSDWIALGKTADADRVLAWIIELHLRKLGDVIKASMLLPVSHSQVEGVPSESQLRLELLLAELRDRAGAANEAQEILDGLQRRVTVDWPPRFRVWLALVRLALTNPLTPESSFELLVDALGEITPTSARVALLAPLERVKTLATLPSSLVERFIDLLPDSSESEMFRRDQALHDLRVAEALRVVGRSAEALVCLEGARSGLLVGGATLFPLRELLLAEERLGRAAEAFDRGAPLVPSFLQEFEGVPLLGASLLLEQARRGLHTRNLPAIGPLLDRAEDLLRSLDSSLTIRLSAILQELRAKQADWIGQAARADTYLKAARELWQQLGDPGLKIPLIHRAIGTGGGSVPEDASAEMQTVDLPLLQPRPRSFTVSLRSEDRDQLVIETTSREDALTVKVRSVPNDTLTKLGVPSGPSSLEEFLPEGFAPLSAVLAFAENWKSFGIQARDLLLQPAELVELAAAKQAPPDLRLEILLRGLQALPWEFLLQSEEPLTFLAGSEAVRHFYRAAPLPGSQPVPIKWIQQALRRLGETTLAEDGVDSIHLRDALHAFQAKEGLSLTGQANAETRWMLDRHLRGLSATVEPLVLLIAPSRKEQVIRARGFVAQQGIDLVTLYHQHDFQVFQVTAAELNAEKLRDMLAGRTPAIIHVSAGLEEGPSLGSYFHLDGWGSDPGFLTVSFLDDFLKELPETELPPLVILDPPRPPSVVEAVRQLFLRNAFAADLFRLSHAPLLLGTGLGRPEALETLIGTVIAMIAAGHSLGAVADLIRRSAEEPDQRELEGLLYLAGTALFAHDPESRAPGAGSVVAPSPHLQEVVSMPRTIYALLVGIDDYPSPIPRLQGCVNDIEAFAAYLEQRVNQAEGIALKLTTLTNAQATRQAVIDAFRTHLGKAGANDITLFYYSGHGSQEQAPEEFWPLEPDHLDETLVCYDSRQDGSWDLADKELAKLISEVARKEPHVAIVLDCCHSGSGTRAPNTLIRRAPSDTRRRPIGSFIVGPAEAHEVTSRDAAPGQPGGVGASRGRHVLLAACRDNQEAYEYSGDGKPRGAFSYFLGDTLRTAASAPTYRELFTRTAALVSSQFKNQVPQLEAPQSDDLNTVFLDGAIRTATPSFTASFHDQAWYIDGGSAHGIPAVTGPDMSVELALYPFDAPEDKLRNPDRAIATAHVAAVFPARSRIELQEDAKLDPRTTYKAVLISLPAPALAIRLEGDVAALELFRKALSQAGPDGKPSLFVREAGDNEQPKFRILAGAGQYVIARPGDDRPLVAQIDGLNEKGARQAVSQLEHIARWTQTAELTNPLSTIKPTDVQLSILVDDKEVVGREVRLEYQFDPQDRQWKEPTFKLRLTNTSKRRLYCAVLDLTEMFKVDAGLQETGSVRLEPGETAWALGGEPVAASVPDELWQQGVIEFKDTLKLIVATEEFDARLLEQGALDAPTRKGGTRALPRNSSLNRLMRQMQTRDVKPGKPAMVDDWQTSELSLTTIRPLGATPLPRPDQSASLPGGVRLSGHAGLRANVRLFTEPLATRDLGSIALPRLLIDDPSICQALTFTSSRSGDPGLSVLELTEVSNYSEVTPEAPLRLTIPLSLAANEHVLPVASDGEFFLPLGRVASRSSASTEIVLERLPPPLVDTRSLGGAIKIFFHKVISRVFGLDFPYPILAAADVAPDATVRVENDMQQIRQRVEQAQRIVLFVHGIIGDTRSMVPAIQLAKRADSSPLASLYDLILTFDYENLNTTIEQNARGLKKRLEEVGLGAGHAKSLDIVAHSMGGLVARSFIEQEGGNQVARRLIMLGTPNAGSPWPRVIDWATLALGLGLNQLTVIPWPATVLGGLTALAENPTVALNEMAPHSAFLESLAGSADPAIPYIMLAGNTSLIPAATKQDPQNGSLFGRMLARLTSRNFLYQVVNPFFLELVNDIAVAVESMASISTGRKPAYQVRPVACDHLSYFREDAGLLALAAALEEA
jgi:tetratricopeptide (TPR) repeat protein